jgi:hypothetical protein
MFNTKQILLYSPRNVKLKKKKKINLILEQAAKTRMEGRYITLLFIILGSVWGWVINATPQPLYPRESSGTHYRKRWVWPGALWTGAENLPLRRDSISGSSSP